MPCEANRQVSQLAQKRAQNEGIKYAKAHSFDSVVVGVCVDEEADGKDRWVYVAFNR